MPRLRAFPRWISTKASGCLAVRPVVAPGLGGGVVVVERAAGREHQRVLGVRDLDRRPVLDRLEEPLAAQHAALVQVLGRRAIRGRDTATAGRPRARSARGRCRRTSARQRRHLGVDLGRAAGSRAARRRSARISSSRISQSARASPGGSTALRTRCTRRSELVKTPSFSAKQAAGQDHVGEAAASR